MSAPTRDAILRANARATIARAREQLIAAIEPLDANLPESDELARLITECRLTLDRLAPGTEVHDAR